MIKSAVLDGELMDSNSFSALDDKIVVSIGIDKAASDLIQCARVVNRRKGNNRLYVQALSLLLGPVAEEYYNETVTFGSPLYPIAQTTQFCLMIFISILSSSARMAQTGSALVLCSSLFR